ncbi:MAG: hypothetical protein GY854_07610 [Deltaproteobacteria bacterium]|nr:hypothetical protein [Deltaproteobacteria bacterium]
MPPEKAKEIETELTAGNQAVASLDLSTAQMHFEQAFAKCDEASVKGPLLARVYMALGALFAGYLQQVPHGTEFMKMALQIDPTAKPDAEIMNDQVTTTLNMVRESLGIAVAVNEATPQAGPGDGAFWVMKHERVTQGKQMNPFGIYVETNPMVAIQGARLFFRFPSDRKYKVINMRKKDSMYGMMIECDAIALLDPKAFFYYIEVIGGDGSIIAREADISNPVEMTLLPEAEFKGEQPLLPGLPAQERCNPDQAAPCPPWDPHCKDMPCVTTEDCLSSKVCREGFCVETGEGSARKKGGAIGIVIAAGLGLGAGVAVGQEETIYWNQHPSNSIPMIELEPGFSPSWMHTRLMAGYYILDNLLLGAFVRFQHIRKDQWLDKDEENQRDQVKEENHKMKISGLMRDRDGYTDPWRGPMWGPTLALFLWGNGEFLGPGQIKGPDGELADKQGFRVYSRFEFNIFGAMYHEVTIFGKDEAESVPNQPDVERKVYRQHVSGMQGLGLGGGVLFGLHKYVDLGAELMYDLMFPDLAHNFDLQFQLQFHF